MGNRADLQFGNGKTRVGYIDGGCAKCVECMTGYI